MATITVRDLDEITRDRLKVRAARHGRSMEAEAREILSAAVAAEPAQSSGLGTRLHALFAEVGGADELADAVRRQRVASPDIGADAPNVFDRS